VLKSPEGAIVGGVTGEIYWDWLYIDLLWVSEELRGQEFGRRLVEQIEREGQSQG
jgi:ribosomal protein S18 acetylase RimI-like enzyme